MKNRIIQFASGFIAGDAISNEMTAIDNYFSKKGYETGIFASFTAGSNEKKVKKSYKYVPEKNDILIYHHSIHSGLVEKIKKFDVKKVMVYHNVTPHHFFELYDFKMSHYLKKGRDELAEMKDLFDKNLAVSRYNASELEALGFSKVSVVPIIYDFSNLKKSAKKKSAIKNILFVGRIAPNKKLDDLIRFAAIFRLMVTDSFKLTIVGYAPRELSLYKEELDRMVDYYDLAKHVVFSGFVSDAELQNLYSQADLFLSLSEHEGFCVPVLESMYFAVPVLAYECGVFKETLDGAGVLVKEKDFGRIALMAEKLLYDDGFRNSILEGQNQRIARYLELDPASLIEKEILN